MNKTTKFIAAITVLIITAAALLLIAGTASAQPLEVDAPDFSFAGLDPIMVSGAASEEVTNSSRLYCR